ncbi:MAG: hypothetical protein ACYCUM_14390 [Solirubrobacteraceae bacterium]
MSAPASHEHHFKLDWVRSPQMLAEQQRACAERTTRFWGHINAMQSSQLVRSSQRTPERWAARCHRLAVATICLEGASHFELWQRALTIESRVPAGIGGAELRALRRTIRRVRQAPVGDPRTGLWATLADARNTGDLAGTADLLERVLAVN